MVKAQDWLNLNFPIDQRNSIEEIHIFRNVLLHNTSHQETYQYATNKHYLSLQESLIGVLDLSTFHHLKVLSVENQFIHHLNLTNCQQLERLQAPSNFLRRIDWPASMPRLKAVYITDNNLEARDLSCFANSPRLENLFLGTSKNRIKANIYNRWNGSLSHLCNLTRLQELDINATDVNDGLIGLPTDELFYFTFGNGGREGAGVDQLKRTLENHVGLVGEAMEDWAYQSDSYDDSLDKVEVIREWQSRQQLQAQIVQVYIPLRNN